MWNASFNLRNMWNQLLIQQISKTFENMPKTSQDLLQSCSKQRHFAGAVAGAIDLNVTCQVVAKPAVHCAIHLLSRKIWPTKKGSSCENVGNSWQIRTILIKNFFCFYPIGLEKMGDGKYLSFKQPGKVYPWTSQALSLHEVNISFSWMDWDWKHSWYYICIC